MRMLFDDDEARLAGLKELVRPDSGDRSRRLALGRFRLSDRLFHLRRAAAVFGVVLGVVSAVLRRPELGRGTEVEPRQLPLSEWLSTFLGRLAEQYPAGNIDRDGGDGFNFAGRVDRL